MGFALSKVGINVSGVTTSQVGAGIDHEFDFRYSNAGKVRAALKALARSINDANTAFMHTPARMVEVGEGFMSINACMNHGGAGGVSQSAAAAAGGGGTDDGDVNSNDNEDGYSQRNNATSNGRSSDINTAAAAAAPHTRVNRGLARDTFDSAQAWAAAMRNLRERDYQAYRGAVETEVLVKARDLSDKTDAVLSRGKAAEQSIGKHAARVRTVDGIEKKCATKGRDVSSDVDYSKAVAKRDEEDRIRTERRNSFHDAYEDLMADMQAFAVQSMDRYLDLTVAYNKEIVRVIDASGSTVEGQSPVHPEKPYYSNLSNGHDNHTESIDADIGGSDDGGESPTPSPSPTRTRVSSGSGLQVECHEPLSGH